MVNNIHTQDGETNHHTESENPDIEEDNTCQVCGEQFDSQQQLWGHKSKHD